jgi:hypothetical protein
VTIRMLSTSRRSTIHPFQLASAFRFTPQYRYRIAIPRRPGSPHRATFRTSKTGLAAMGSNCRPARRHLPPPRQRSRAAEQGHDAGDVGARFGDRFHGTEGISKSIGHRRPQRAAERSRDARERAGTNDGSVVAAPSPGLCPCNVIGLAERTVDHSDTGTEITSSPSIPLKSSGLQV